MSLLPTDIETNDTAHIANHNQAHKKLNRTYDVMADFGATGDGSTDDTANLQACLNAAIATGGEVTFGPGDFLNTGLYISSDGAHDVDIRGAGRASRLILKPSVGTSPAKMLTIGSSTWANAAHGITVHGLTFDGNERNITNLYGEDIGQEENSAPVHVGIDLDCSYDVRVYDCNFYDIAREAVWLTTVRNTAGLIDHTDVTVENCHFERMGYLTTIESSQRVTFKNNFGYDFRHTGTTGPGYAISLNWLDMRDVIIEGNVLEGAGGFSGGIVTNFDPTHSTMDGVIIANNTVRGFSGYQGIAANRCLVTGNVVAHNDLPWGIRCGSDTQVVGNRIEWNTAAGILVDDDTALVSRVLIADNVIHSNNTDGNTDRKRCAILLGDAVSDVHDAVVTGNQVYDTQGTKKQYAIGTARGYEGMQNNKVFNNDFTNNVGVDGANFVSNFMANSTNRVRDNAGFNPIGRADISVGSSPYTYTNNDCVREVIYIRGGADVSVQKGGDYILTGSNVSVVVEPEESIIVAYTSIPLMVKDKK